MMTHNGVYKIYCTTSFKKILVLLTISINKNIHLIILNRSINFPIIFFSKSQFKSFLIQSNKYNTDKNQITFQTCTYMYAPFVGDIAQFFFIHNTYVILILIIEDLFFHVFFGSVVTRTGISKGT